MTNYVVYHQPPYARMFSHEWIWASGSECVRNGHSIRVIEWINDDDEDLDSSLDTQWRCHSVFSTGMYSSNLKFQVESEDKRLSLHYTGKEAIFPCI